ncbi:hypothetical protein Lbru_2157 [Legionella brunensis]|uniref:Uncharacterized protein n=2 Tax=Legionella brunensis TaxID=29422 RepID=A0A0W0SFF7_9GAMM|nr:hypothetical protein Lbru_2157 [Legionella brunensis]
MTIAAVCMLLSCGVAMSFFFKRTISINHHLRDKLTATSLDESFVSLINRYGDEPAQNRELQPEPGFLLGVLLAQQKIAFVKAFLQNEMINGRHQFITLAVYQKILASEDRELIALCNSLLKECPSEKHKALVLYPIVTETLNRALHKEVNLHQKVMKAWEHLNLEELLVLNIFLQFKPNEKDIAHYFKGGMFAVQDGGELKQFFQKNLKARDRSHECSHLSITPAHSTQGKLIPEFLFGDRNIIFEGSRQTYNRDKKDSDSYSWFQTEYASVFGESMWEKVKNYIVHKICFVIYWLINRNIGPYGTSDYKEKNIRIFSGLPSRIYAAAMDEGTLNRNSKDELLL